MTNKREDAKREAKVARDYPFEEAAAGAHQRVLEGWYVYQKWTCQHCGVRQTMPDANHFYEHGRCEECKQVTNIRARGCNYMRTSLPIDLFLEDDSGQTKH